MEPLTRVLMSATQATVHLHVASVRRAGTMLHQAVKKPVLYARQELIIQALETIPVTTPGQARMQSEALSTVARMVHIQAQHRQALAQHVQTEILENTGLAVATTQIVQARAVQENPQTRFGSLTVERRTHASGIATPALLGMDHNVHLMAAAEAVRYATQQLTAVLHVTYQALLVSKLL